MNIKDLLGDFTSKITSSVSEKAKDTALSTLNDPEIKAAVSQFTKEWINENKVVLAAIFGSFLFLSLLAVANIITNFKANR